MKRVKRSRKRGARLGQHFLTSFSIAGAVAEAGTVLTGESVLEVGPGKGMLTRELLARGARVTAVEKDPMMVAVLEKTFAREIAEGALTLITRDIRDVVQPSKVAQKIVGASAVHGSYKVIANIPYYLTGELLRMFLAAPRQPTAIVCLVQKEVAERIARSKKESLLSLSVKAYGTPRYVRTVKAGSFSPPPSVDSAILAIEHISRANFSSSLYGTIPEETFFALIHAGFAAKRKTLVGNLKKVGLYREEMALDPKVRAEDVPLTEWLRLACLLERA